MYTEKINALRLYSGDKFEQVDRAEAGEICAVLGLSASYTGQGLGNEYDTEKPILEPVLSYRLRLPDECDLSVYFPKLKELEEEEPSLHLYRNDKLRQIEVRLMGDIQTDVLKRMILDRFSVSCELDEGNILYKEKAAGRTVGIGHFEPLRHYAEVQLLIEPQPNGTGLIFDTHVPGNTLEANYQRLILSHLYEKTHLGTLTGAELTDTRITLVAGKAHLKHTEGGDFREATLRAVRQGLMKSGCVLLEPYYKFRLELPASSVGRAMSELQAKSAEFSVESSDESSSVIVGRAPVSELHGYAREVISYTRGLGRLTCLSDGYEPCHNAEDVVKAANYDPEADLENTPHSVFCSHGAGFVVPWNEVDAHKHLTADVAEDGSDMLPGRASLARRYQISEKEIEAIMLRTFGPIRRKQYSEPKRTDYTPKDKHVPKKNTEPKKRLTIVDGYNVIYAWESLRKTSEYSLEKARESLLDVLSNYSAYTGMEITVVFDAYLVKHGSGSDFVREGCRVVYTAEDQTADAFIEKMMRQLGPNYDIRVVTGDRLLQFSAVHSGISRMTAKELEDEIEGRELHNADRFKDGGAAYLGAVAVGDGIALKDDDVAHDDRSLSEGEGFT